MNQFRIKCSEVNYFTVLVEADSEAAAVTMANANINAFEVEDEYTSEWTIEEVEELLTTKSKTSPMTISDRHRTIG